MVEGKIYGIKIGKEGPDELLQKIKKYFSSKKNAFFHIVNLNPEIFVLAYHDFSFRKILNQADALLIDGVGIEWLCKIFGLRCGKRMPGREFMSFLIKMAVEEKKKVMFLGGFANVAEKTGKYFKKLYPALQYLADSGASKVQKETFEEKKRIISQIKSFQPDFLFVAYGPPFQERWIFENREDLKGIVCMGVGSAFNFYGGKQKVPPIFALLGLEWWWRLLTEPKRGLRKISRYLYFFWLLFKGFFSKTSTFNLEKMDS